MLFRSIFAIAALASPAFALQQEADPGSTSTCTGKPSGTACTYSFDLTDPTTGVTTTYSPTGTCAPNGYCLDNGATCQTDDNCYNYCGSDGICGGGGAPCNTAAATSHASLDYPCFTPGFVCGASDGSTSVCGVAASGANSRRRRDVVQLPLNGCAGKGMTACPVSGEQGFSLRGRNPLGAAKSSGAWECVNTLESLEQCGGCNEHSGGVDCSAIPNVAQVGCVQGKCVIESCDAGFLLNKGKCL